MKIEEKLYDELHLELSITHQILANAKSRQGKYEDAMTHQLKVKTIQEHHYPKDDVRIAPTFNNLATLCAKMNEVSEAVTYLELSLDILIVTTITLLSTYQINKLKLKEI